MEVCGVGMEAGENVSSKVWENGIICRRARDYLDLDFIGL